MKRFCLFAAVAAVSFGAFAYLTTRSWNVDDPAAAGDTRTFQLGPGCLVGRGEPGVAEQTRQASGRRDALSGMIEGMNANFALGLLLAGGLCLAAEAFGWPRIVLLAFGESLTVGKNFNEKLEQKLR